MKAEYPEPPRLSFYVVDDLRLGPGIRQPCSRQYRIFSADTHSRAIPRITREPRQGAPIGSCGSWNSTPQI